MADTRLPARAGVAIRLALGGDPDARMRLEHYIRDMDDGAVTELQEAAQRLSDTASYVLGRRQT